MKVTRVRLHIAKQVFQIHAADARRVPSRSVTDSRKSNATSRSLSAAGGIVLLGEPLTPRFLIASAATLTWASAGARTFRPTSRPPMTIGRRTKKGARVIQRDENWPACYMVAGQAATESCTRITLRYSRSIGELGPDQSADFAKILFAVEGR